MTMKEPRQYNITPAKGQALLNFQGRRFPDKVDLFETEAIEKVRSKKPKQLTFKDKETSLNADFTNLLIQGDCLSACAYLKSKNIKVDLVYIDPPFASGAKYAKKIYLRNNKNIAIQNQDTFINEEIMYGDIWQKEDYLNWLYERLLAIQEIMSEKSTIFVHLDWHISHYVKILMDEIFGESNLINEIIWWYPSGSDPSDNFNRKHDNIFWYSKRDEYVFNFDEVSIPYTKEQLERFDQKDSEGKFYWNINPRGEEVKTRKKSGIGEYDVWNIGIDASRNRNVNYPTAKPPKLLERIIKAASDKNMIIADFFGGSGVCSEVAHSMGKKFIHCDINQISIQTARDILVKDDASFDILKIKDGLRLFRNPAQTTARMFNLIDGFRNRTDLNLSEFWDGGIAQANGSFTPVKFVGIHEKLTKELLDVILEEIYQLEGISDKTNDVTIIYAHKELDIDQDYIDKQINKSGKTTLKAKLVSLDNLLGERADAIFMPDNADIKLNKAGKKFQVEIEKYFSPYLKNKIDDFNAKKTKKGTVEQNLSKAVKISENGLELIESVQFDTTLKKDVWISNLELEDKAGIKEKIKGKYLLDTDKFRIKIRNIAGDEIVLNSETL